MRAPIKDVGLGFAAFLRREMSCNASCCHWQWYADRSVPQINDTMRTADHYVHCAACGSSYPWRDTYYLRRIYELEAERDQ